MSWRAVLAALFCWVMVPASQAQTYYQCLGAQGKPVFSEQPCPGFSGERVESLNCQKARRDFDIAANSGGTNSNDLRVRRSAMYGACGMKAPEVTIIRLQPPPAPKRSCAHPTDPNCAR